MKHTRVEFRVSRRAAEALPISGMSAQARALGILPSRIDVRTSNAGRGQLRLSCSLEMATYLLEQFRELVVTAGARKEPLLLVDASLAVSEIVAAIADARGATD